MTWSCTSLSMMTEPSPVVDSLAYVIRIEADVLTLERLVVYVTPKLRTRDQLYFQLQFSIQIPHWAVQYRWTSKRPYFVRLCFHHTPWLVAQRPHENSGQLRGCAIQLGTGTCEFLQICGTRRCDIPDSRKHACYVAPKQGISETVRKLASTPRQSDSPLRVFCRSWPPLPAIKPFQ